MKILALVFSLFVFSVKSQTLTMPPSSLFDMGFRTAPYTIPSTGYIVTSKYDTIELNKGDLKCNHSWAVQTKPISNISCAVMHDAAGCPDSWMDDKRICTICLRHERIVETRTATIKANLYDETVKKLKK